MQNTMDFTLKIRVLWSIVIALVCVSFINSFILIRIYAFFFEKHVKISVDGLNSDIAHRMIVDQFYRDRKYMSVSKLGGVLFKNEKPVASKSNKTFIILMWRNWKSMQIRHLYSFGQDRQDPLEECSVKNCKFTGTSSYLGKADAVVVSLLRGKLPVTTSRKPWQRWIFLNDESPANAFGLAKKPMHLSKLHNLFNWSMTYMTDSDIPVPYGRTVALETPVYSGLDPPIVNLIPNWRHKQWDVLITILISNCKLPYRNKLIANLKGHVKVDVYGECGEGEMKSRCEGYFTSDCEDLSHYLFYLVLENGKCIEYMTEKLFYNAYNQGAIPIIQGPTLQDCQKMLPPNSYLHVDNYATLKELAEDVKRISRNEKELHSYHVWRNHFEIVQEHGYFGTRSKHLCRICEALNYDDGSYFVYSKKNLEQFLDPIELCRD